MSIPSPRTRCSSTVGVRIGVLALQGDVSEHVRAFEEALAGLGEPGQVRIIRRPCDIDGCSGLALPGGESTTISRILGQNGLYEPLSTFRGGIFATCAGMVLLARETGDPRVRPLGLVDITVNRNAFGRQRESFEADIPLSGMDGGPFRAAFIRAPAATRCGPKVDVLAHLDEGVVAVASGPHLACAFHPELGDDRRVHRLFLSRLGLH